MSKSITRILIRESHLDTFGHVNNATYLTLFEEARWDIITANGYGLAEVQKHQQGPVILELKVQFRKELHLREEITIETEILGHTGKIGELKQIILNQKGEICTIAEFKMGFFDLKARKLIEPTPAWLKGIGLA